MTINPLVPAAFCAGFFFLPETKAYSRRKQAESGHISESRGLVSRSASVNGFDSEHPRRSVFDWSLPGSHDCVAFGCLA